MDNLQPMKPGEGTVIVIGAGPAGIQSAMTLTERGYHVEMYDKRDELCGSLNLANKAPNKFRMDNLVHWYRRQVEKNPNITVHLNTEITPEKLDELAAMKPHAVVLACGGQPIVPGRIPGIEKGIASFDVLRGDVKLTGKRVAVIGGGMTGPYEIPVDCTVLSLGIRPDSSLLEELESRFENVVAIGDCVNPGRIGDATGAAFLAVKNL